MTNLEQKFLSFLRESDSVDTVSGSDASARSASAERKEAVALEPPKRFWWLKTSGNTDEEIVAEKKPPNASTQSSLSSSMAEFLAKERLCREGSSKPSEKRSPSPEAESRVDEYSEDFTDDDISSIMDQINLLAGSGPEDSGSKSVDDILREAEEVVQERQETSDKKRGAIPKHKDYGLPPPLSKPPAQLIVNLKEKKRHFDDSSEHKAVADDANAIFDQIDREVRNKIAAARLKDMPSGVHIESNKHSGFDLDDEMKQYMSEHQSTPNVSQVGGEKTKDVMRGPFSPLKNQPLSIVIEESLSEVSSLECDVPSHSKSARDGEAHKPGREASHNLASRKEQEASRNLASHKEHEERHNVASHKANHNEHERGHYASEWSQKLAEGSQKSSSEHDHKSSVDNINRDLMEQRKKYEQLRAESDQKQHYHKQQLSSLKRKHEDERLALERDLGHFKAKLKETEERSLQAADLGGGDASNPRLRAMEQELRKQEQISQAYQSNNIHLCQELKHLKSELKARETHEEKFSILSTRRDTVKWLSEKEELNEKVKDRDERILALNLEIEMLKNNKEDVEKSADKLQLQNAHLREEVANDNQLLWEGKSFHETTKSVAALEREVDRQTEDSLRKDEECERLRHELRCVADELEGKKQELNAAAEDARRRGETVEARIASLETELKREREKSRLCRESEHADKANIQDLTRQVREMEHVVKQNHPDSISALIRAANCEPGSSGGDSPRVQFLEERVKHLEDQLGNTKAELECSVSRVQDKYKALKDKYDVNTSTLSAELAAWKLEATAVRAASKKNPQIVKEDSHLLATIRGLQQELAAKEKAGRGTEKKLEDANKTNKRLQAEREKILQQPKALDKAARKEDKENKDKDDKVLSSRLKILNAEKEDQILQLQSDLMLLRERRLQDLEELQLEHEVELQHVVAANSTHAPGSRLRELHAEIYKQQTVIDQLREQLAKLDECRAEVLVLKVEREHLEKSLKETNKKLNILREAQTPDDTRHECLLDKISQLEIRHESREQKLQAVVRDLLRINQDKGTSADVASLRLKLKQKDEEIWQFKMKMDKIVKRLMELEGQVQGSQASD